MEQILLIALFIIGALFLNASHLIPWFLSGEKPTHQYWKIYALIALCIWLLTLFLANISL